jgi:hypothetical protein
MDNKAIKRIVKNSMLIAVAVPILINLLMFFRIFPVSGDVKTWISTLGTFWGAVSGGLISGAITYFGVKMTVQSSENGINISLNEQRRIREEELFISTSKERLLNLYHPIDALYSEFTFLYGAHEFSDLQADQRVKFIDLINLNSVYGDSKFYTAFIELKWAMRSQESKEANRLYDLLTQLVTEEVEILRERIKLPEMYTIDY